MAEENDLEEFNRERLKKQEEKPAEPDVFEELGVEKEPKEGIDVEKALARGDQILKEQEGQPKIERERSALNPAEAVKRADEILKQKKGKKAKKTKERFPPGFSEKAEVQDLGDKKRVKYAETEIVRPKKSYKLPELSSSENAEKGGDSDTEIAVPKDLKRFTVKVEGEKETQEESDIYRPKDWREKKAAEREPLPENIIVAKEDGEEKEEGTREEDLVEEEVEDEEFDPEEVKNTMLKKARTESVHLREKSSVPLKFLEDGKGNVFIGRKKSVQQQYGNQGGLFLGRVAESELNEKNVYLDSLNPHVVFVCGARGSGKSYVLGVIAEELALNNKQVGSIVIDPIGVFWSMKHPNREEKELESLASWGLMPNGLDNLKVFIPQGVAKEVPPNTYDATFSMQPSLLTAEDWCLTFGIDRFSPTGLLLGKVLKKVEKGFQTVEGNVFKGKEKKYSLDDLVHCLEKDAELNSREKGYKQDSIRALVSRFEAAKSWGIFDEKGTPLAELSREGQLTVMDTSFLEDSVTALVIGVLARRLLAARKISTRKEASKKFKEADMDELLELEVPPTWLFIDEAHTLIPAGNTRTPASSALIEYVKQGRRPGLSLVFATQQPSAIDTKVLSQLDVILSHKLVFDDDIKAVFKRTPTIIPLKYKRPMFLKTLPVGVALSGDRSEESSRAFVMRIRPRMSQHEGRDATTTENIELLEQGQIDKLAFDMANAKLRREGQLELHELEALVDTLNSKYQGKTKSGKILESLVKAGAKYDESAKLLTLKDVIPQKEMKSIAEVVEESAESMEEVPLQKGEQTELIALAPLVGDGTARKIANALRHKKMLGLFGREENLKNVELKYRTLWKVQFNEFNHKNEFAQNECYIDSVSGEFLHLEENGFSESKGLNLLYDLNEDELKVVKDILKEGKLKAEDEQKGAKIAQRLTEKGILKAEEKNGIRRFLLAEQFELPPSPRHPKLASLSQKGKFVNVSAAGLERENISKGKAVEMLQKLWPNVVIKKVDTVHRPVYEAELELEGKARTIKIDAVTGKELR
ncbi:MAG: DUF87 domain-containing protein [Candidatus Diapherotrites archaeon]